MLDRLGRPVHASKVFHSGDHLTLRLVKSHCLVPLTISPLLVRSCSQVSRLTGCHTLTIARHDMAGPFHLAWFTSFRVPAWRGPWGAPDPTWASGEFYIDLARQLERACFDYLLLEDTLMVSDVYGGTAERELAVPLFAPKQDPVPLAAALTQSTSHIGLVPTMSTSFYPPYLLARTLSTLDSLSRGRAGWNVVTSAENRAAQNFGMDALPEHDERYDMADEYMSLVTQLWDSWDPLAMVMDRESGIFADHRYVRPINFEGTHYRSRGPLNCAPAPQGRPVIAQAGSSARGLAFAAQWADTVVAAQKGVAAMKEFRDKLHQLMRSVGRAPRECKLLWLVSPVFGETAEEARLRSERGRPKTDSDVSDRLAALSANTEIDFSRFDRHVPLADIMGQLQTNGERGTLHTWLAGGYETLWDVVTRGEHASVSLCGTPDMVAEMLEEINVQVGGDGFLIRPPVHQLDRRYVTEVVDGLVPALQRRGLCRRAYASEQLRDTLFEF